MRRSDCTASVKELQKTDENFKGICQKIMPNATVNCGLKARIFAALKTKIVSRSARCNL
jgi:hypothetical protein